MDERGPRRARGEVRERLDLRLARHRDRELPAESVEAEVLGAAAGELLLQLHDLQGRVVASRRSVAGGSGRDVVRLDLGSGRGSLRPGVYLLRVRGADGRRSRGIKLAVVR